jgi:hypothetical protein
MTEPGIPDTDCREDRPRTPFFAGPPLLPVAAALSLFGTLSVLGSAIIPRDQLSESVALPVIACSILIFFVAVMTSCVAIVELLFCGIHKAGSLTLGRFRIRGVVLGSAFLVVYLLPWGTIALWIWYYAFHVRRF